MKVNVALIRLFQLVVAVLFTTFVLIYFGTLVLLPLDLVVLLTHLLGGGLIGALIAIPAVAYLGKVVYGIPGLLNSLVEIGLDLVNMGKQRVDAFNELIAKA